MVAKQAFRNLDGAYAKAFNSGDAAGIAALYTRDATYIAPNGPAVKGRKAIHATASGMIAAGWKNIRFKAGRSGSSGDLAFQTGQLSMDPPPASGARKEKGKYVDIYKRQKDGSWKIDVTIYNSDMP